MIDLWGAAESAEAGEGRGREVVQCLGPWITNSPVILTCERERESTPLQVLGLWVGVDCYILEMFRRRVLRRGVCVGATLHHHVTEVPTLILMAGMRAGELVLIGIPKEGRLRAESGVAKRGERTFWGGMCLRMPILMVEM